METVLRVAGILLGSTFAVFGGFRLYWEVESWRTLSTLGERPALVEGNPRIPYRYPAVVLAVGVTLVIVSIVL